MKKSLHTIRIFLEITFTNIKTNQDSVIRQNVVTIGEGYKETNITKKRTSRNIFFISKFLDMF